MSLFVLLFVSVSACAVCMLACDVSLFSVIHPTVLVVPFHTCDLFTLVSSACTHIPVSLHPVSVTYWIMSNDTKFCSSSHCSVWDGLGTACLH